MEPYNTCRHGVDIERNCRLCDLLLEKETKRIKPKNTGMSTVWLTMLAGITVWLIILLWRIS